MSSICRESDSSDYVDKFQHKGYSSKYTGIFKMKVLIKAKIDRFITQLARCCLFIEICSVISTIYINIHRL